MTGLDPRIDTGLDVSGRGQTATACVVSERVPLPTGERGVTARGLPLSRVARMTARGQAGDYLPPLPACELRSQDGWPDVKPRRVWRRLPLSLLWFLEPRRASLLLQEGVHARASVCGGGSCQVLYGPVKLLVPGSNGRLRV